MGEITSSITFAFPSPLRLHNSNTVKTMLKALTSNISFFQREKILFHRLEEALMKRTKMSKSGFYQQGLLEYHARLPQSVAIR